MGRAYPRFLLSKSTQAKSKGTFIIHTLNPAFIAEPEFNEIRQIVGVHIVEVFEKGTFYYDKAREIAYKEIPNWWKYSGIHDSYDSRDKIISGLSKLLFLNDRSKEFTVEEAREVLKIVFPTKAKNFCHEVTTYGIKHDFERISSLFNKSGDTKSCNNETIKEGLVLEGFNTKEQSPNSPNLIANLADAEVNRLRKMSFYRINNLTATDSFV